MTPGSAPGATVSDVTVPDASIIIVSWNVRDLLRACLASVYAQARRPADAFEVIVVDNASHDDSVAMVREEFPQTVVIASDVNGGFARGNNAAFEVARGRHIVILNPDTVVLDGALDRMIDYLDAHADVGAIGCRLLNSDGSFQRWTAGAFPSLGRTARHAFMLDLLSRRRGDGRALYLNEDVDRELDVDWVSGACMALRREAFGDTLFDESFFMYGEDAELCERVHRRGWRVVYIPHATVVHHHGKSMAQQTGAILLTAFKGPRAFYIRRNGRSTVWLYDLLLASGFALRWGCYLAGSAMPSRRAVFRARAASSRSYMTRALRVMVGQ